MKRTGCAQWPHRWFSVTKASWEKPHMVVFHFCYHGRFMSDEVNCEVEIGASLWTQN
jgi:hypothetical protein